MRRVISTGLLAVVVSGCAVSVVAGRPDFDAGCFRDSEERVVEMIDMIAMGEDKARLRATVDWIRDMDAECESWRTRPWWRFW